MFRYDVEVVRDFIKGALSETVIQLGNGCTE